MDEYTPLEPEHEVTLQEVIEEKRKNQIEFEDLTLAEALREMWYAPVATLQALLNVATPARQRVVAPRRVSVPSEDWVPRRAEPEYQPTLETPPSVLLEEETGPVQWMVVGLQFMLYLMSFIIGMAGGSLMASGPEPVPGVYFIGLAFALALIGQVVGTVTESSETFVARLPAITPDLPVQGVHVPLLILGFLFAISSYYTNSVIIDFPPAQVIDVRFTLIGVISWLMSTVLVAASFYRPPLDADPYNYESYAPPDRVRMYFELFSTITGGMAGGWHSLRNFYRNERLVFYILLAITLFGAFFRLQHLNIMLPEMTSDHVEKLLDAQRVYNGDYQIFFANNQGREPFQMYALALIGNVFGINFMTLKALAAFEAILTLPVVFWLGREIIGERDRRFGTIFGLSLALLLSVSYWHFAVARVALRIILTPLVVSLFLIYLIRGMRRNSRADFIKVGLILGFGLYTYQAIRMLPVVLIAAAGLALLFHIRSRRAFFGYAANFVVALVIAAVIFIPMFRYSVEYPEEFWRRATGRLFGDALVEVTNENGEIYTRSATLDERIAAFNTNLPILGQNMVNALLMFHFKGDVAWLHGMPNHETMDVLTSTFLVVGLGAWFGWSLRRRDAVYWMIPVAGLIMLLPSALSIALPIENPSHTRSSGAMPEVYAIAGFGLAVLLALVMRFLPRRTGVTLMLFVFTVLTTVIYAANYDVIYDPGESYRENYLESALPHSEGGRLMREFAESQGGAYGNAFIVSSPYWWDHRAVAIEALLPPGTWENTIPEEGGQPKFSNLARLLREAVQRDDRYTLDPNKDLLFFFAESDNAAEELLMQWFPTGYVIPVDSYMPGRDYFMFRVPALGYEGLREILAEHGEQI